MVNKLEQIEWHDRGIISMNIEFSEKQISFEFDPILDETDSIILEFCDVSKLVFEGAIDLEDLEDLELTSGNFKTIEVNNHVHFIFLTGSGKPTWEISFEFNSVNMSNRVIREINA